MVDSTLGFPNGRCDTDAPELAVLQHAVTALVGALLGKSAGSAGLCEKAIQSVKVALVVKLQLYFSG